MDVGEAEEDGWGGGGRIGSSPIFRISSSSSSSVNFCLADILSTAPPDAEDGPEPA